MKLIFPRRAKTTSARHFLWIWNIWKEKQWFMLFLLGLSLLSSAVAVTFPYLYKILLDSLQKNLETGLTDQTIKIAYRIASLIMLVGIGSLIASLASAIRGAMNSIFEHLIRDKYFGIVMDQSYEFITTRRTGDTVTRLTDEISPNGVSSISWFLCSGIFRAVEAIAVIAFCLAAMFVMNWKLTLFSLLPLPLCALAYWFAEERIHITFKRNQEAVSDINSQLELSFSGIHIIKAQGCEKKYNRFFEAALARRLHTENELAKLDSLMTLLYQYIDYFAQIALILAGGLAAARGDVSIGTFYAFYNYLGMMVYPILDIPQLFISGKRAFVHIDRLEELRAPVQEAEQRSRSPQTKSQSLHDATAFRKGGLSVRNLSYAWADSSSAAQARNALDTINFDLEPGMRLAVLGPVGAGKSTLLKLLCGVLTPQHGQIIGDAMFGYVPQTPSLFSGTIRENVAFGAAGDTAHIDDTSFSQAIDIAQLQDEIAKMPDKERMLLGQRGINLSGGQRQRMAIARAIARAPRILLLDDITASLDAANEEKLMQSLARWSSTLSCIMVSHRLSTLRFADKVLFLEKGRVAGIGTHDELVASCPSYRDFILHSEKKTED